MLSPHSRHSLSEDIRACDLLSKQDRRSAGGDKFEEMGGKVPGVVPGEPLSGDGEGLAGRASGPDGPVVGPAGKAKRVGPSSDSGEEVTLVKPGKVGWFHVED